MLLLEAKLFWMFVVNMLLLSGMASESKVKKGCIQSQIEITQTSECGHPSGFWNIPLFIVSGCSSQAVSCEGEKSNCNIMITLLSNDPFNITLTEDILSKNDIIVLLQPNQSYTCVSMFESKTGFCWKGLHDNVMSQTDIKCGDSPLSSCKKFKDGNTAITIDASGIINSSSFQSLDTGSTDDLSDLTQMIISSSTEKMGDSSTMNITMGTITGVITKIQPANNIRVGITTSGDVEVLGSIGAADLFSSVDIPAECTSLAANQNSTVAAVLLFRDVVAPDIKGTFFANKCLAIEMGAIINNLSQPITITFKNVDKKGSNVSCVSWNGSAGQNWTTDGCYVKEVNKSITCECYHLTFFALLMSTPPANISAADYKNLSYITSIGCGLSMLFLAVGLFMHCLIRKGKASQATKILMNLFVAMFMLDLSFLVNESIANLGNNGACVVTAAVMHYTMLATISWFFVEALHIYLNMWRSPNVVKHYLIKTGITGWGTPSILVIILLGLQKYGLISMTISDGTTSKMCWILDSVIQQGVNIGYYAIVFIFTFAMFIATVRQVVLFKPASGRAERNISIRSKTCSILGLIFLLGLTWAFAFFSYGPLTIPSYYIFTLLNSFQGFLLFIYYYKTSNIVVGENSLKVKHSKNSTELKSTSVVSPYK